MDTELTELTRKLVSIPSHEREEQVGDFIIRFLQGFGHLQIERQRVAPGRFNVVAHDGHAARLMFVCHTDTVAPSAEWQRKAFEGEIDGDRLHGLGAVDMKGGIACLLDALGRSGPTRGLWLLFDVDEERQFKGMRRFLERYAPRPQLAVFPEPTDLAIQNGHRGLIEVHIRVRGETGHAARPEGGKNAILGATRAVEHLLVKFAEFSDPSLGSTSCNLAYLAGGLYQGETTAGGLRKLGREGNQIPNVAEAVIDIRPASGALRAQTVLDMIREHLRAQGFELERGSPRHDFGSLLIAPDRLGHVERAIRAVTGSAEYADLSHFGYGEGQLLNEKLGVDSVYFGPGPGEKAHQADEFVSIAQLHQTRDVFVRLIHEYCGG